MSIPHYVGPPDFSYGGSEIGTFRLCEELQKQGIEIAVCHQSSRPQDGVFNNQLVSQYGGTPPYLSILRALKRTNSDIYHSQLNGMLAFFTAMHSKRSKKPYFLTMRALDCIINTFSFMKRPFIKVPPKITKSVFVTYNHQVGEVKTSYGVNAIVAPDPIDLPKKTSFGRKVLFVNRFVKIKRPLLFLKVVKDIDVDCEMVGYGPLEMKIRANASENVNVIGKLTPTQTKEKYMDAAGVVTTSTFEGVPCVWREAWSYGVPVVSTGDRGNMLCGIDNIDRNAKGLVVRDGRLEEAIRLLVEDKKLRNSLGKNGRNYVRKKHDPASIAKLHVKHYESVL